MTGVFTRKDFSSLTAAASHQSCRDCTQSIAAVEYLHSYYGVDVYSQRGEAEVGGRSTGSVSNVFEKPMCMTMGRSGLLCFLGVD